MNPLTDAIPRPLDPIRDANNLERAAEALRNGDLATAKLRLRPVWARLIFATEHLSSRT